MRPSILPKDLSVWGMFMAADWLVQAVMVGLAVASVVTCSKTRRGGSATVWLNTA